MKHGTRRGWIIFGPWRYRFHENEVAPGDFYLIQIDAKSCGAKTCVVPWEGIGVSGTAQQYSNGQLNDTKRKAQYANLVFDLTANGSVETKEENTNTNSTDFIPLAFLLEEDFVWSVYLPVRIGGNDGLFQHAGSIENASAASRNSFPTEMPTPSAIELLLNEIYSLSSNLGSHECSYFKHNPLVEYEYKLNLRSHPNILVLARDIRNEVGRGDLSQYRWEYRDDFQSWTFDNYLFEVSGPKESDRGYVSFIPKVSGGYVIKRKIFPQDGFKRVELKHNLDEDLTGVKEMRTLIENQYSLRVEHLGNFRRTRFDVTLENIDSGNIHSIMIDECDFESGPKTLRQIEVEYLRSRGKPHDAEYTICQELSEIESWCRSFLLERNIPADPTFHSKYTHLKQWKELQSGS